MEELEKLYREIRFSRVKILTRILGGDQALAEDVIQEAFTRAIVYYKSFDKNRGELNTWFNSIMFNTLRDIQRSNKGWHSSNVEEISAKDVLNDKTLSCVDNLNDFVVGSIFDVENEKHQRILYLFFVLGYTSREIGEIEGGVSQSNVTTVVNRFKESLKERVI